MLTTDVHGVIMISDIAPVRGRLPGRPRIQRPQPFPTEKPAFQPPDQTNHWPSQDFGEHPMGSVQHGT